MDGGPRGPPPGTGGARCGRTLAGTPQRAGHALTVQGQEVPARVHARRAAPRGERGAAGHTPPAASGPSRARRRRAGTAVGGGRRWARDTAPPPPAARAPAPPVHQPASLPARPGGREGGPRSGPGSPPSPGPRRVDAPRPEIASALPLPPPLPPPAAGPVITEGGPAPRPARGRLPGLGAMLPGTWRHPREGQRPVRAQASSRRAPQVCSPLRRTGARVRDPQRGRPALSGGGGSPPAPLGSVNPRSAFGGGCVGRGGKLTARECRECRELTLETPLPPPPTPKLLAVCAAQWLTGVEPGRVVFPGSNLWMASQEAVQARGPYVDPRLPPSVPEPRHPLYRVLREPPAHRPLGGPLGRAPRGPPRMRGAALMDLQLGPFWRSPSQHSQPGWPCLLVLRVGNGSGLQDFGETLPPQTSPKPFTWRSRWLSCPPPQPWQPWQHPPGFPFCSGLTLEPGLGVGTMGGGVLSLRSPLLSHLRQDAPF